MPTLLPPAASLRRERTCTSAQLGTTQRSNVVSEDGSPSIRDAVFVALNGRCFASPEFPWREPDTCLADGFGVELADAPHVHLEDDDAEEIAVFAGLALTDGRRVGLRATGF